MLLCLQRGCAADAVNATVPAKGVRRKCCSCNCACGGGTLQNAPDATVPAKRATYMLQMLLRLPVKGVCCMCCIQALLCLPRGCAIRPDKAPIRSAESCRKLQIVQIVSPPPLDRQTEAQPEACQNLQIMLPPPLDRQTEARPEACQNSAGNASPPWSVHASHSG